MNPGPRPRAHEAQPLRGSAFFNSVLAFQAFVAGISDRCDVPPVAAGATIVGGYR